MELQGESRQLSSKSFADIKAYRLVSVPVLSL
jgi:hypothetical protein